MGIFPKLGMNIKNVWNHHPVYYVMIGNHQVEPTIKKKTGCLEFQAYLLQTIYGWIAGIIVNVIVIIMITLVNPSYMFIIIMIFVSLSLSFSSSSSSSSSSNMFQSKILQHTQGALQVNNNTDKPTNNQTNGQTIAEAYGAAPFCFHSSISKNTCCLLKVPWLWDLPSSK